MPVVLSWRYPSRDTGVEEGTGDRGTASTSQVKIERRTVAATCRTETRSAESRLSAKLCGREGECCHARSSGYPRRRWSRIHEAQRRSAATEPRLSARATAM